MAEEAPLLLQRQTRPDVAGGIPDGIEGVPPADAPGGVRPDIGADPAQHLAHRARFAMFLDQGRHGRGDTAEQFGDAGELALFAGQQPAPGDGVDPPPVSPQGQGGDHVDRGQAAADQQYAVVRSDGFQRAVAPGIAGIARGLEKRVRQNRGPGRPLIADRQHHEIRVERGAAGEFQAEPGGQRAQRRHPVAAVAERRTGCVAFDGGGELTHHEAAEGLAPGEELALVGDAARIGRPGAALVQPAREPGQVLALHHHQAVFDVEAYRGIVDVIGRAAADPRPGLDHHDLQRRRRGLR